MGHVSIDSVDDTIDWKISSSFTCAVRKPGGGVVLVVNCLHLEEGWAVIATLTEGGDLATVGRKSAAGQVVIAEGLELPDALTRGSEYLRQWLSLPD